MSTVEQFVEAAGVLSTDHRLQLIDALWDTIPVEDWPQPPAEELAIVRERARDYDDGRVSASSWSDVRSRLRTRIEQNNNG